MSDAGFVLSGYEDLEISTQIIIRDALNRGIDVDILDRTANFLCLHKNGQTEYVQQATKTAKDSYIAVLIMANKAVSKWLLQKNNLLVPRGQTFAAPEAAIRFSQSLSDIKIVIKPATTNFGIGIFILGPHRTKSAVESAIAAAFSFASTIMVEEFTEGSEYRFLVVDFKTIAVCQRVPANIQGDGLSTIRKRVEEKNSDPRRGQDHKTPLEKIQLGETELSVLKEDYGYHEDTVPSKGEMVFLRRNSNISTGGDSIDATDTMDPFYKQTAEKAAKLVNARICGVDMILTEPGRKGTYAVLELNFNPVLYIHNYPFQGKNRNVGDKILDLLGF